MENNKKAGLADYLPLILMTAAVFTAASLIFTFVLKNSSPVLVFIFFAVVQVSAMIFFVYLPEKRKHIARKVSMIIIGSTIVFLAGLLGRQNFQLEGLIFMIMAGILGGPVIHFTMKIAGSVLTGRSWCSWGCWTAAVLDFLPFRQKTEWKNSSLPRARYIHFTISVLAVVLLYSAFAYTMTEGPADAAKNGSGSMGVVYWFITGNVLYYSAGIVLAFRMKDNRAFCKYLCPVAVPLKLAGMVSLLRIKGKNSDCSGCKKCEDSCPASIKIHSYIKKGERAASTECMVCMNCIAACPEGNLKISAGIDLAKKEKLNGYYSPL